MGRTTQKTKSTNQGFGFSAPFAPAMPGLGTALRTSANIYGATNPYEQYANANAQGIWDNSQKAAMHMGWGLDAATNNARALQASGGYTPEMRAAFDRMSSIEGVGGPSYSEQNLAGMARGDYLDGNPHLDSIIANSSRDIREGVNENASAMGRFGSGAHQSVLGRQIGDMSSNLRYQDFNNQQGMMMGANQMMDANRFAGLDREMGLASGMFGMGQQALSNQIGAYNQVGSIADQIYGLQANSMMANRAAAGAGMDRLAQYAQIPMGIGGMGGFQAQFQTGEQESPGQSPLQQIAGLGTAALGLFG